MSAAKGANSLSKGAFFFAGAAAANDDSAKRRRQSKAASADTGRADPAPVPAGEKSFTAYWNWVEPQLQAVMTSQNETVFADLAAFARAPSMPLEIPTALLCAGINVADHGAMFTNLARHLRNHVTPHFAMLNSRECAGGLRGYMRPLFSQLLRPAAAAADAADDDAAGDNIDAVDAAPEIGAAVAAATAAAATVPRPRTLVSVDMHMFSEWYDACCAESGERPPVVILLQDFEAFDGKDVSAFVELLALHQGRLPFVLIFGIASSPDVVYGLMSRETISHLNTRRFRLRDSSSNLPDLYEILFFSTERLFRLDYRPLSQLLDNFLYYNLSVSNFVRGLKFAALAHFLDQPASFLCLTAAAAKKTSKKHGATFSAEELDVIRRLPSFRPFVENQESLIDKKALLLDDAFLAEKVVTELVPTFQRAEQLFFVSTQVLHVFVLKNTSAHASVPERFYPHLHVACLQKPPVSHAFYRETIAATASAAADTLEACVADCVALLARLSPRCDVEVQAVLATLSSALQDSLVALPPAPDSSDSKQNAEPPAKIPLMLKKLGASAGFLEAAQGSEPPSAKRTRVELTRRELLMRSSGGSVTSAKLRGESRVANNRVIAVLEEFFGRHLQPPHGRPLFEAFYSKLSLSAWLDGQSRVSLFRALTSPVSYLHCDCCPGSGIQTTMPDTVLLFKLHEECGRMINMHDWLMSFVEVVSPGQAPSRAIQARFMQGVAELQLLGFVKKTGRKADHVERLTWGRL